MSKNIKRGGVWIALGVLLNAAGAFAAQAPEHMSVEDAIAVYAAEYDLDDQAQKELATRLEELALPDGTVDSGVVRRAVADILLKASVHEVAPGGGQQGEKEEEDLEDMPLMEEVSESEEEEKKEAGADAAEQVGASLSPVKPSKSKREGKRSGAEKELLLHLHELGRDERKRERAEAKTRGVLVKPGKEKGTGRLAQQKLLEQMAEQVMSFLPQPWNIQIPPGKRSVEIDRIDIMGNRVARTGSVEDAIAVSPDNRFVAVIQSGYPAKIVLWDMVKGEKKELPLTKEMGTYFYRVAFRPESHELIALTNRRIYRIDLGTLAVRQAIDIERYGEFRDGRREFAFSLDGNYLIAFSRSEAITCKVWNVANGELVEAKEAISFLLFGSKYKIDSSGMAQLVPFPLEIGGWNDHPKMWLPDGIRVFTRRDMSALEVDFPEDVYQVWNTQTLEKECELHLFLLGYIDFVVASLSPDRRYMLCFFTRSGSDTALAVYDLGWEAPVEERGDF